MASSEAGVKSTEAGEDSKMSTRGTSEKSQDKEESTLSKKKNAKPSSLGGSEKLESRGSKSSKKSGGRSSTKSSKQEPKAGTSGVSKKPSAVTKKPSKETVTAESCAAPPPTANAGEFLTVKARIVGAAALVCIGSLIIVLGFIAKQKMKQEAIHNLACVSQECREVAAMTESLMDRDVKPCDDFYRHVCGHWIKDSAHPSSFMIDAERNFSLTLHRALMEQYGTGNYSQLLNASSVFYGSCLTFLANKVDVKSATEELFKALHIVVSEWLATTDPVWFFAKILHLSLVNRFHTLLSIGILRSESKNITILVELTKPLYALAIPEYDVALREVLKTISKEQASDPVINEVLQLDKARQNETIGLTEMKKLGLEHTSCPTFTTALWTATLEQDMGINGSISARVMNYDSICDDLEQALVYTDTAARPLYLLLLVSADVLRYDFKLHADRSEQVVREVCYRATADAFGVLWLHLMSRFLQVSESVEELADVYEGYARAYMKKVVHGRKWMGEADRNATLAKIEKIRVARFYSGIIEQPDLDCFGNKPVTSTGFVSNMVRVRTVHDVKNCAFLPPNSTEARIRLKLLDNTIAIERDALTVVLPHFFAVPPVFYRRVEDDKFINIAVVGTHLARGMLSLVDRTSSSTPPSGVVSNETRVTSGWSFGTLANFSAIQRCYDRVTKFKGFHEPLTDAEFDEVFNVVDAVRVGYAGKSEFSPEVVTKDKKRVRASDAMFFKRVCLSLCTHRDAPPNANSPSFATAYASCLFAVARLPQFAKAFGCKSSDAMWHIKRCCID